MNPLADLCVLITRPAGQAEHLTELIERAGGKTILFPALEIGDARDERALGGIIDRLETFDLAIFVSPSAVDRALQKIQAKRAWPAQLCAATIGRGSQARLLRFGIPHILAPQGRADSEALLALPELQEMADRQVVIFRGEGGRELLDRTLALRGAEITSAVCYRRNPPTGKGVDALLEQLSGGKIDAIVVTSSEGARNLFGLPGATDLLKKIPLFVPHERIAATAKELGAERVFVTSPGDEGLQAGLISWRMAERT